jgi:hypothetical protein
MRLRVKGTNCMAIVENGSIGTATANAGVRVVSTSSVVECVVREVRFYLVLHHSGLGVLHNVHVGIAGQNVHVTQQFKLLLSLKDTAFYKLVPQGIGGVSVELGQPSQGRQRVHFTAISSQAMEQIELCILRKSVLDKLFKFICELDLVDLVVLLVVLGSGDLYVCV